MSSDPWARIDQDSYALVPGVLSAAEVAALRDGLAALPGTEGRPGARGLLQRLPGLRALTEGPTIRGLVEPLLGPAARPVRALLFDKTAETNWGVTWHQDLTIAVAKKAEVPGFGPWSRKDGVDHVQPPLAVLEAMLTLRLHLDPAGAETGGLMVLPGSHREGRRAARAIPDLAQDPRATLCAAEAGDILAFRPLLLHASRRVERPSHRRVVHLEFASTALPPPLVWYEDATAEVRERAKLEGPSQQVGDQKQRGRTDGCCF